MRLHASPCPAKPEEVTEAYVVETLDAADAAAFEEHCLTCARRLAIVEATDEYVRAMRESAGRLRKDSTGSVLREPDAH
jgi:hypothetical protein